MSQIRKRSLKATIWIYFGFLIGAVNTYFFTHKGWFLPDQYGLTRVMIEISQLMFAVSTLGVTNYIFKFFPYYTDNVSPEKNDLLSVAMLISFGGFLTTMAGIFFLQPLIVRKFSENSGLLVEYFFWTIPMAFSILIYNLLEAWSYGFNRGVLANFLRETALRGYTLVVVLLKIFNVISFKIFVALFAFQYAAIAVLLAAILIQKKQLWFSFTLSRVTKKIQKKKSLRYSRLLSS